jgi:transposase
MKAYSLDLRQKILDAYLQNEGSIRDVAQRFKVSFRFVWGLVHQFRQTGSYAPKPRGGGNPPRICAAYHELLRRLVAAHADATLAELCDLFAQETAIQLSKSSMHRTVEKLQLTRKKKRFVRQNKTATIFSNSGKLTGRR